MCVVHNVMCIVHFSGYTPSIEKLLQLLTFNTLKMPKMQFDNNVPTVLPLKLPMAYFLLSDASIPQAF